MERPGECACKSWQLAYKGTTANSVQSTWEVFQFLRKVRSSQIADPQLELAGNRLTLKMGSIAAADDKRDMPRADELVPRTKPTWGGPEEAGKMKVTWMGHAAALVEMPRDPASGPLTTPSASASEVDLKNPSTGQGRGVTVLFDPAFSKRCSPTQWFGSVRYQREFHP